MPSTKRIGRRRIYITKDILYDLLMDISKGQVSDFAREKGLPYFLVYRLVHGRTKSLSRMDYRLIFGQEPPYQESERVDGKYFRRMVRLWMFLNDDATRKGLFREFFPHKKSRKVDYRIFTGQTKTVLTSLQRSMEEKLLDQGLRPPEIQEWIDELHKNKDEKRVPYDEAKTALNYLKDVLRIGLKYVLNQPISRYESGQLKTISIREYRRTLELKRRAEKALHSGSRYQIETLREEIGGRKKGYTLFSEIEDQLVFIEKHGTKGLKQYLGRSITHYRKSELIRIASWRARRIKRDCDQLIKEKPDMSWASLPRAHMRTRLLPLLSVLKSRLVHRMLEEGGRTYERPILMPLLGFTKEYEQGGYIGMDHAGSALGMRGKAFDLMVAAHADIFRKMAKYDGKWCLPNLYIEELKGKEGFDLVKAKYTLLSQSDNDSPQSPGERRKAYSPEKTSPHTSMTHGYGKGENTEYRLGAQQPALPSSRDYFDNVASFFS